MPFPSIYLNFLKISLTSLLLFSLLSLLRITTQFVYTVESENRNWPRSRNSKSKHSVWGRNSRPKISDLSFIILFERYFIIVLLNERYLRRKRIKHILICWGFVNVKLEYSRFPQGAKTSFIVQKERYFITVLSSFKRTETRNYCISSACINITKPSEYFKGGITFYYYSNISFKSRFFLYLFT